MRSLKNEKILLLIIIVFVLIILTSCYSGATYYNPGSKMEIKITEPEIGIESKISLGEPIINSGYGHYSQVIEITNSISIKNKLGGKILISNGFYELVYSNENESYYTAIEDNLIDYGDPDVNCQLKITNLNDIEIIAEGADAVYSALAIPVDKQLKYNKIDQLFISKSDSFQQTMVYLGKNNNILRFSYREFYKNMIRDSFTTEITYDLSESKIIGFKNFKAEIIEATNSELKYKIISSF